jgi:hypothetical protein
LGRRKPACTIPTAQKYPSAYMAFASPSSAARFAHKKALGVRLWKHAWRADETQRRQRKASIAIILLTGNIVIVDGQHRMLRTSHLSIFVTLAKAVRLGT